VYLQHSVRLFHFLVEQADRASIAISWGIQTLVFLELQALCKPIRGIYTTCHVATANYSGYKYVVIVIVSGKGGLYLHTKDNQMSR